MNALTAPSLLVRPEINDIVLMTTEHADTPIQLCGENTRDGYDITAIYLATDAEHQTNLIDWFTSKEIRKFEQRCNDQLQSFAESAAWTYADSQRDERRDSIDSACGQF
jgi:hypothetical protein